MNSRHVSPLGKFHFQVPIFIRNQATATTTLFLNFYIEHVENSPDRLARAIQRTSEVLKNSCDGLYAYPTNPARTDKPVLCKSLKLQYRASTDLYDSLCRLVCTTQGDRPNIRAALRPAVAPESDYFREGQRGTCILKQFLKLI